MKTKVKNQLFFVIAILFQTALWAQPGMNDDGGALEGNDPAPTSIDDGMFWLVLVAIFLAYLVIAKSKNRERN